MDAKNLDNEILNALGFTPDPRITIKIRRSAKLAPETRRGGRLADLQIFGSIYMRIGSLRANAVGFSFFWNADTDRLTHQPQTIQKVRELLESRQRWLLERTGLEKTAEAKEATDFHGLEIHMGRDSDVCYRSGRARNVYIVYWTVEGRHELAHGSVESLESFEHAETLARREAMSARKELIQEIEDGYIEV